MQIEPHLRQALGLLVVVIGVSNGHHPRAERADQVLEHAPAEERPEHLFPVPPSIHHRRRRPVQLFSSHSGVMK